MAAHTSLLDPRTPSILDLVKNSHDLVATHFAWHCPHCDEICFAESTVDIRILKLAKDPKEYRASEDMVFITMLREEISTHLKEKHA